VMQCHCETSNHKVSMPPPFDIFKVESNSVRWMEAAVDLQRATARVTALAASSPGEYIIPDQNTGEKISIKPPTRRIVFQIGYDEKGINARAELLRRFGHKGIRHPNKQEWKWSLG
jgi:hypothetical protein